MRPAAAAAALAALAAAAAAVGPAAAVLPNPLPSYEALWPQPASLEAGSTRTPLPYYGSFAVFSNASDECLPPTAALNATLTRVFKQIFWTDFGRPAGRAAAEVGGAARVAGAMAAAGDASLGGVSVCVRGDGSPVAFPADESYELDVPAGGVASLSAATLLGAMHGLQTFAQLVAHDDAGSDGYYVDGTPLSVRDAPRYPWRGLLVDTARHFLPVSALLRQVDAMAASKLNVLHWHVVDAQSFPFQSASYPLLAEKGAYHPSAQYSADDVRGVVAYGAARGVRVMPEFDVPGHSASWAAGYPGVVTRCPKLARNINNLNLSPASNETLPLLRGVLADAAALWSDAFLHLGGDEVVEGCWAEDPAVQAWMAARNTTTKGVYQYFVTQATAAAAKLGRRVIQWQEVVDFGLDVPLSTVIEVWKAGDMQSVTSAGYDVVMASGYYLDQQVPDPPSVFYEFLDTWKGMFTHDPAHNLTSAQAAHILGGEAAMWGEQVSDLSIDTRIWPRAAAVAERLWSPPLPAGSTASDVTSADVARLNAHACRLQRLGVASSPVAPGFCLLP